MTKKTIRVTVGTPKLASSRIAGGTFVQIFPEATLDVETSVASLIETLQKFQERYGADYENLGFESRNDCGCRYDCSCSPTYVLVGNRLETDLEYDYRVEREAEQAKVQIERERREYEKLKAKFGG